VELPEGLRGVAAKEAEIIDAAPTLADLLGCPSSARVPASSKGSAVGAER